MKQAARLTVEAQGECDLVMRRSFAAPRALVFTAYTQPELVKRWLGARAGWEMAVCEIDLRVGGLYRYLWRHVRQGFEMGMGGQYLEVVAPERIVCTEVFDTAWYPGGAVVTAEFADDAGATVLTTTVRYESREARDGVMSHSGATEGVGESYDNLAELLQEGWLVE